MRTLRNASVPSAMLGRPGNDLERVDIALADGRIAAITPAQPGHGDDLDGGLVLPAFIDVHTHLDKGQIWPRKPNPDGTWMGALLAVATDRDGLWSRTDVGRRMDFALRSAYAHGTAAIRTHLDSIPPQQLISWDLFADVRDAWRDRIELQAVALVQQARLVIGLDTGLTHIAAAYGKPTIELYCDSPRWKTEGNWSPAIINLGDLGAAPREEDVLQAALGLLA